jgi:hypothetical protein
LKKKDEIKIIRKPLSALKIDYKKIEFDARAVVNKMTCEEQEYFINALVSFREEAKKNDI